MKGKYSLKASDVFFLDNNKTIDLSLDKSCEIYSSQICGLVFNASCIKENVPEALICVFSIDNVLVSTVYTSSNGMYNVSGLKKGKYYLTAVKNGYVCSDEFNFEIMNQEKVIIDIPLYKEEHEDSIIYGIVSDEVGNPISGVMVKLYEEYCGKEKFISKDFSIDDGEYVFDNLRSGTYKLEFFVNGMEYVAKSNVCLANNEKYPINIVMKCTDFDNIISGSITNECGNPIADAYVGLYKVTPDTEELIKVTYTNDLGKYIFYGEPNDSYIIKSKY